MKVRAHNVNLATTELFHFIQNDLTVSRPESCVDDENGLAANNDPDIGNPAHVAVGNHVDVVGQLHRGVLAD